MCIFEECKIQYFVEFFKFFQIFFKKPLDFLITNMYNVCQKGVSNICAKMGRPKSDNPKGTQLGVRLDAESLAKLDMVAKANSVTRAEALRRGIEIQYEHIKK